MLESHVEKKVESIFSFYLEEEISNAQPCILLPLWIDYVHNENYSTFVTQCSDNLCNRIRHRTANGRTALEEIKCPMMRALTADPLSVGVVNFEVFLEDFFHCHFPLEGQAIILTYGEKNKAEKTLSTKTSKFIWCNSQSSRLHHLLLSACQKLGFTGGKLYLRWAELADRLFLEGSLVIFPLKEAIVSSVMATAAPWLDVKTTVLS